MTNYQEVTLTPGVFRALRSPVRDAYTPDGVFLTGFYNEARVYRVYSPLEQALSKIKTMTAVGIRYLNQPVEPQQMGMTLLPEDSLVLEANVVAGGCPSQPSDADSTAASSNGGCHDMAARTFAATNQTAPPLLPDSPGSPSDTRSAAIRRFANDSFEIRRSALGGWGAFAVKDLCVGDPILQERPIIRTVAHDLDRNFGLLDKQSQTALLSLHAYSQDPGASHLEKVWSTNAFLTGNVSSVFEIAARFNHSCAPNIHYRYDGRRNIMVMTAAEAIARGTELVIHYGQSPQQLYEHYGSSALVERVGDVPKKAFDKPEREGW